MQRKKILISAVVAIALAGLLFLINTLAGNPLSQWNIGRQHRQNEENAYLYRNDDFGFTFTLPISWQDYAIITEQWQGRALEGSQSGEIVERGPLLLIRHPQWTAANPRQDIPIMVFTTAQWQLVQQEKISLGAAPIPPSELGRNSLYIFALPARYNFAFPTGFEEVESILANQPLQPVEITR